jgi:hypothetical protein
MAMLDDAPSPPFVTGQGRDMPVAGSLAYVPAVAGQTGIIRVMTDGVEREATWARTMHPAEGEWEAGSEALM